MIDKLKEEAGLPPPLDKSQGSENKKEKKKNNKREKMEVD